MLGAEPLIVARIKERLVTVEPRLHVFTAPDLAGVTEEQQFTPAVHVVYGGHRISQEQNNGQTVEIEQTWHTVVVVRNVRAPRSGRDTRAEAGVIMDALFRALAGWKPALQNVRAMRPANTVQAGYSRGFGYYPLSWTLRMHMRGEP